jgi:hypothetical protein
MRALLFAMTVALALSASARSQVPTTSQTQEIQERVKRLAQEKGEELAFRVRVTTLGALDVGGDSEVRRWDSAVRQWKQEKGAGAAPLLAEGVLFDCLGRLQGVKTRVLSIEKAVPYFADLAAQRPSRAAKAFDAALKIDPSLIEARMRAARIRAPKDPHAARELEQLAEDPTGGSFSYLAAISRAEAARAKRDVAGALRWYDRSLVLEPRSTAAAISLSSLRPGAAVPFADIKADDLYYSYPCTILTPGVAAGLQTRVKGVVLQ